MPQRMTAEEWVKQAVASAPPLTQQQQADLRRLLARPSKQRPA